MIKHSSYFEGKVQSLGVYTKEGFATIGVITPGEYTFGTSSEEKMVVTTGKLNVKLPGEDWKIYSENEFFIVPANSSFDVAAKDEMSYVCYYR